MKKYRKFYKTRITFDVLSEEPISDSLEMADIVNECIEGSMSGATVGNKETVLNGLQMAKALQKQGSSPEFFQLNEKGEDL